MREIQLPQAVERSERLAARLAERDGVLRAVVAGETRRFCELVRRLDVVVETRSTSETAAFLDGLEEAGALPGGDGARIVERTASALTGEDQEGLAIHVHAAETARFGSALLLATGSETHVEALRARAVSRGLRLEGGALRRGETLLPCASEEEVYRALELPAVIPELREGRGEVATAVRDGTGALLTLDDLRGVVHVHTDASDGKAPLEVMVRAAADRGYRYIGIADHSRTSSYAGGLSIEQVREQRARIDALNRGGSPIPVLAGIECDILADGSLDYPDDVLASFDFVVASIHARHKMGRDAMTARVLAAVRHPSVTILAHPTGRYFGERREYDLDVEAVIRLCAREGVALELNANPRRLELDWRHHAFARSCGATIAVNPDAHTPEWFDNMRFAVGIARKGGLTAGDVLNTRDLEGFREFVRRRSGRAE